MLVRNKIIRIMYLMNFRIQTHSQRDIANRTESIQQRIKLSLSNILMHCNGSKRIRITSIFIY